MAFVATDWTITRSNGNIRYVGDAHNGASPSYATVIQLHRALADFADDAADLGDDELSIIDQTPSDRGGADTNITLLNGFNIDQTSSEHLYDGSITQANGAEIYDGIQVFGNATSIQIIQDGARLANDFWNEPNMISAVEDATSSTSHRFLVLVRTGDADIDGRRLLGTQRVYGTVYTEFAIGGGTNRGNNVLALTANSNLNNATAAGTVATYTDIVNDNEGYVGIDADGNSVNEFYYSNWETGSRSKNDFFERAQYLQREGTAETLYGLDGDIFRGITHSVAISGGAGTWVEPESLSWGTGATAGTGQLLAVDDTTGSSSTILYMQLLSGVVPSANTITGNGGATATAGTVTSQLVSLPFVGASTGTAIIGAFGLGIGADDLAVADLVTALDGTPRNAPNNVTFTVQGIIAGDRVLVTNDNGGDVDFGQLTVNGALTGAAVTSVVVDAPAFSDIPSTGTLRLQRASGTYSRHTYSNFDGTDTFTIASSDFSTDNVADNAQAFISYIDVASAGTSVSFTYVYDADRTLFIRVRDGGASPIKTFETTAVLGNGDGSTTAIRTSDE